MVQLIGSMLSVFGSNDQTLSVDITLGSFPAQPVLNDWHTLAVACITLCDGAYIKLLCCQLIKIAHGVAAACFLSHCMWSLSICLMPL